MEILIATALVTAVSTVLAGLLLLAERFLARYGTCVIDVNDGARTLQVAGGQNLLASLMGEGIFIPSACGGRGTCGYCKCRVLQGGGPVGPTEIPLLTTEDLAGEVRISCQVKVRNDLRIRIPEELFLVKQFRGVVRRIRDLTHDIKELRIELIEPETIQFTPGQYIQLEAPAYGDNPEAVYRAYSISSPPADDRHVELIIRLVPGGICTTWVFTLLKEGDEVRFNGPYGQFRLSDSDAEMVWIAGGSGMAPFWSILRHMRRTGLARGCTFFFGAVQQRDIFFLEELRQAERELSWFTYVPALSAPTEEEPWDGQTGLITEVVDQHLQEASTERLEAYLCGSAGMIDAARRILAARGIPEERIFYDKFT